MIQVATIITDSREHIGLFLAGGGAWRLGHYISTCLPPLPENAGWWTKLAYALVKGLSGHDPTNNPSK